MCSYYGKRSNTLKNTFFHGSFFYIERWLGSNSTSSVKVGYCSFLLSSQFVHNRRRHYSYRIIFDYSSRFAQIDGYMPCHILCKRNVALAMAGLEALATCNTIPWHGKSENLFSLVNENV